MQTVVERHLNIKMQKILLKNLNRAELEKLAQEWGEKPFRGRQIFAALYKRGLPSVNEMTDLPLLLRERLLTYEPLDLLTCLKIQTAPEGTCKALLELQDGLSIESVWMPEAGYVTQCLSTQVGCPLDCTFCATGLMGFKRNLTAGEIIDQVIVFRRMMNEEKSQEGCASPRNLVFMGMGEPLLNYDNLIKAIRILSDIGGPAIAQRRMTVSTAGIIPGIKRLAQEGLKIKLAISLNAPTDTLRDRLMPINKKYPLKNLLQAVGDFQQKLGGRITFEYALMPGINDSEDMIKTLRSLLRPIPCKLNLIPLNDLSKRRGKSSDWDGIFDRFYRVFAPEKITLTMRRSRGAEIQAACGQLATSNPQKSNSRAG